MLGLSILPYLLVHAKECKYVVLDLLSDAYQCEWLKRCHTIDGEVTPTGPTCTYFSWLPLSLSDEDLAVVISDRTTAAHLTL